jgi:hypothetical protein
MSISDAQTTAPGRSPASARVLVCLVVLFIAAGCGTLLLTGQNHHAEARIVCERFVKRRLPPAGLRFSGEKVRDLSATRHVVTGTALAPGGPARNFTCTVTHAGRSWALEGMTGV